MQTRKPSIFDRLSDRIVEPYSDESSMKAIFDHVRNLGICAAVLVAAGWKFKTAGAGWLLYFDYAIATVVGLLGLWLFIINQANGFDQLVRRGINRKRLLVVAQVYNLAAITIIASITSRGW